MLFKEATNFQYLLLQQIAAIGGSFSCLTSSKLTSLFFFFLICRNILISFVESQETVFYEGLKFLACTGQLCDGQWAWSALSRPASVWRFLMDGQSHGHWPLLDQSSPLKLQPLQSSLCAFWAVPKCFPEKDQHRKHMRCVYVHCPFCPSFQNTFCNFNAQFCLQAWSHFMKCLWVWLRFGEHVCYRKQPCTHLLRNCKVLLFTYCQVVSLKGQLHITYKSNLKYFCVLVLCFLALAFSQLPW